MDELTTPLVDGQSGEPIDIDAIDVQSDEFATQFDRQFGLTPPELNGDGPGSAADVTPVGDGPGAAGDQRVAPRWTRQRVTRLAVSVASLVVTTAVMMRVVHLNPLKPGADLIFRNTTPTGGDMGAHVWAPAFLRDHLLPNWRLTGWSMDWFGGFPVYRFYMVVPALAVVAVNAVAPYGVAFKLVAISGLVTFPLCCWLFGRLARFRYPIPALFAFSGICFVLNESYQLYGGNVLSTMAGEFSFSIALGLMVLGLGLLAHSLQTGRAWWWAAIVLALAALSHGIVLIYTAVAATIFVACRLAADAWRAWRGGDRAAAGRRLVSRLLLALTIGGTTVLLTAFWAGPFLLGHDLMTDMKYQTNVSMPTTWGALFDQKVALDVLINTLAVVGLAGCVLRRQLYGVALSLVALATVGLFFLTEDSIPGFGLLWNARLLPLLYLARYLMMAVGIAELAAAARWIVLRRRRHTAARAAFGAAVVGATAVGVLFGFGWVYQELPFGNRIDDQYAWGPFRSNPEMKDARGDGWTRYNARGYEEKSRYPEYYAVVQTMAGLGEERGCGRALWENDRADPQGNRQYGTTMALMLLPFWTDGCIGSMEALFFESSASTPYDFLAVGAMSERSSNPVRQLRYVNNDAEVGIEYVEALGVRYVMLRTEAAKEEAALRSELTALTDVGPWTVYEVAEHDIVVPLDVEPVVVNHRPGDQRERFLEVGSSWFQNRSEWPAMPTAGGPDSWQRIDVAVDADREETNRVSVVVPVQDVDVRELPEVTVSNVQIEQQSVSFDVSDVGVPVLVRVSYFPNWTADGADGPYRIGPNQMVVVPTEERVELNFGRSTSDNLSYALTFLGIVAVVVGRLRGPWRLPPVGSGGRHQPIELGR